MSVDATVATWRLKKKQVTPTQKLILLSYADRADEYAECWPSNRRLEEDTGLDRHTICENKQKLIAASLISYTGEKKGRTKSVDVVRLNYVIHRESSGETCTAQNGSSGEMPIPSSGEMPTAKQWGNAHTEPNTLLNLTEEPKTTTTCSSDSFLNYKPQDDERSDEEFLKQCEYHVNNRNKTKYTESQAKSGLIKILKSGKFTKPAGYKSESKNESVDESQKIPFLIATEEKYLKTMQTKFESNPNPMTERVILAAKNKIELLRNQYHGGNQESHACS